MPQNVYRYPLLFKSSLYTTLLLVKTYISSCFCQLKKIQGEFSFLPKKVRSENRIQCLFCSSCYKGSGALSSESGPMKLLPWEPHSASQYQVARALGHVCKHLCFISAYFVHPSAGCVPRYWSLALHPFSI